MSQERKVSDFRRGLYLLPSLRSYSTITRGEIDFPPVQHTIIFSRVHLKISRLRAIARAKLTIFNQFTHSYTYKHDPTHGKFGVSLKKKKKNELKEQYVDYLFDNSSLILCFTEEQNSIRMQHGEEIGLFTSSVM